MTLMYSWSNRLFVSLTFLLVACSGGDGKSESSSFTEPSFTEVKTPEPEIVIVEVEVLVEVPVQDNLTAFSGKLAQDYVKGATVVADIIRTDSEIGNLQQDPGEVTAVSDTGGGYTLSSGYSGFVFFSKGGTVTNSAGEEVPALPMLAPMPEEGQQSVNITPLTTLVTTQPELKAKLDEIGGWNTDIADPAGSPGSLLRVAKTVETVLQVLSGGESPLLDSTAAQLAALGKVAETMTEVEDISSDAALTGLARDSANAVLNDPNLVAPSRLEQAGSLEQVLAGIENSVAVVAQVVPDSEEPIVEAEIVETIEESVAETVEEVEQVVSKAIDIGLTFTPVIEELQLTRTSADQLTLKATVSDDGPLSQLRYQWSMEGSVFSEPASNPTVLLGYHDNLTGTITLRVTDENGSGRNVLLTRPLSLGEFPYSTP
jgi:hypothetical protein